VFQAIVYLLLVVSNARLSSLSSSWALFFNLYWYHLSIFADTNNLSSAFKMIG